MDGLVKPEIPLAAGIRPLFSAYNSATDNNVTGDGTIYVVICDTEIVDRNSNYNNATGVFTAPVDGYYLFIGDVLLSGIVAAHTLGYIDILTSNRIWRVDRKNPFATAASGWVSFKIAAIAAMDAADTATLRIIISGGALVADVYGVTPHPHTFFEGYLLP